MVALAAVLSPVLSGCGNPSYDVQIEQLPPDPPGVAPSATHRPGQPCLLCHGPYKGARPQFSIAGTVFQAKTDIDNYVDAVQVAETTGVKDVKVTVYDPAGNINTFVSNEKGNFYALFDDYRPNFPLGARMDDCNGSQFTMISRISREGSCNGCHILKKDQSSPGWLECGLDK